MSRARHFSVLVAMALFAPLALLSAQEQQPVAPVQPSAPPPSVPVPQGKKAAAHANDFLIIGTAFSKEGLSYPGVQVRIRKTGEKKFHWETYTNSRGDFAVRVPQGGDYEVVAHVKGFPDQTRTVDAKTGDTQQRLSFRMEPTGSKP